MKKLSLCFILVCLISFHIAADCYMFLGGNYSVTLKTDGQPVNAGGANYTVIWDWGRFRGLYLEAGVIFGSDKNAPKTPYNFDFSDYNAFVYGLGFRLGYPFKFDVSDNLRFSIVPAVAIDFNAIKGKFENNKVSGNGERLGLVTVLSACHKLGGLYLRYGAEFEVCALSSMIYSYDYNKWKLPDGDLTYFNDFMLSPFFTLGWRL